MTTWQPLVPLPDLTGPVEDGEAGFGSLASERGNLPLESIAVRARVVGLTAHTTLVQDFHNPHDVPLEAVYVFPLPSRAAVTGLCMETGGRVVDGVLRERAQARREYVDALASGRRASLAEEDRPGVFTLSVGNIAPGEAVRVTLRMTAPLPYEDGAATYRFPLVVAPRYVPGTPLARPPVGDGVSADTDVVPDASRISPPVLLPGLADPVRLSLAVEVDPAGLPLGEVRSSLHAVSLTDDDGRVLVELRPGPRADRDFVLRMAFGDPEQVVTSLTAVPDEDGGGGVFTLTVVPPVERVPSSPRNVVLVLDRSGSMSGWKMTTARRAAQRIIDSLTSRDRFAVLLFDSSMDWAGGPPHTLVHATDHARARACAALDAAGARGGTQMLDPLLAATGLLDGQDGTIVLLTDGQVSGEDQLLRRISPRLGRTRLHTVGVDLAPNEGLLHRLAAIGGGRCEMVETQAGLDEVMTMLNRRIASPLVTDVEVLADGLAVDPESLAPARIPDLYPGAPVTVSGRYHGVAGGGLRVSGRGEWDGRPEWAERVVAHVGDETGIAAIWARARLRDLEDRRVIEGRNAAPGLEREIVDTSLRHGVLCRFTAFVAVDREVVEGAEPGSLPARVVQPVEPAGGRRLAGSGPGGSVRYRAGSAGGRVASAPGPAPMDWMDQEQERCYTPPGPLNPYRVLRVELENLPWEVDSAWLLALAERLVEVADAMTTGEAAALRELIALIREDPTECATLWSLVREVLEQYAGTDSAGAFWTV